MIFTSQRCIPRAARLGKQVMSRTCAVRYSALSCISCLPMFTLVILYTLYTLVYPVYPCLPLSYRISCISIYTLSDLGDLSNLIGSLSRNIQQYSPPSEWIMCELAFFFPIFLENDLLKVDKILRLTFF